MQLSAKLHQSMQEGPRFLKLMVPHLLQRT